jgi:imidazole glycerol phosphate synthase glutamine amidotransferase subunit
MKVSVLDYGAGNVPSVERALERLGVDSQRATTPACIASANALLLPGVGHYSALIRTLDERGLRQPLLDAIDRGVPFLGICLGLQALYETSDEAPELRGLQCLAGCVRALPPTVKLPHMGWNRIRVHSNSRLLRGIDDDAYFYFAHTFAAVDGKQDVTATCDYGQEFAAVLERQNILAVQFHPEKSGAAGARVLQNFIGLCA